MNQELKQRIIGAIVVTALAAIFFLMTLLKIAANQSVN
jgi:cell division septation protein DedD